jgi:hypothetical protein
VPTGWKIDVHIPDERYDEAFPGDAFIAKALFTDYPQPCWIPYRCLYSRNIANLFMAGRDISVTHEALGATRVMRTGGCMGEVVGIAASVCRTYDVDPREVWTAHESAFLELLRKPAYATRPTRLPSSLLGKVGRNLASQAALQVSGVYRAEYTPAHINDQYALTVDNDARWVSSESPHPWIEFTFAASKQVAAYWLVSGYRTGEGVVGPIESAVLQYHDGQQWRAVEGSSFVDNTTAEVVRKFPSVEAKRFRLWVETTQDNLARVWELQLFAPSDP